MLNFMKFAIKAEELSTEIINAFKAYINENGSISFPEKTTKKQQTYAFCNQCYLREIYLDSDNELMIKYDDRKRNVYDIEDCFGIFEINEMIEIMEICEKNKGEN